MKIDNKLREWIRGTGTWPFLKKSIESNRLEYEFISKYFEPKSRKQWSSAFGEQLVKTLIEIKGENVNNPCKLGGLLADLETEHAFYEVKTRNWSTTGTVGEKILGAPFKYVDFTKHTDKKLYIVLVGYQEYEAKLKFKLFDSDDQRKRVILEMYRGWNIEFKCCSDLL